MNRFLCQEVIELGEGHTTRRCRRVTFPESYITKYTAHTMVSSGTRTFLSRIWQGTSLYVGHVLNHLCITFHADFEKTETTQGYLDYKKPHHARTLQ